MSTGQTESASSATIHTDRLRLRRWREQDFEPFAQLNADEEVVRYLGGPLDREASDALARRIDEHFTEHGFGLFAVEIPEVVAFAGFIGLNIPGFEAHFTPCVEIGWRLAAAHWGRGYATEGAQAVVRYAFSELGLDEVVSFTATGNRGSIAVMQRLGMRHDGNFSHPRLPAQHPLSHHVLYRLSRADGAQR